MTHSRHGCRLTHTLTAQGTGARPLLGPCRALSLRLPALSPPQSQRCGGVRRQGRWDCWDLRLLA